ncbi:MAG: hypothetical protein R3E58_10700 [Phycisphaerae bacterium]
MTLREGLVRAGDSDLPSRPSEFPMPETSVYSWLTKSKINELLAQIALILKSQTLKVEVQGTDKTNVGRPHFPWVRAHSAPQLHLKIRIR